MPKEIAPIVSPDSPESPAAESGGKGDVAASGGNVAPSPTGEWKSYPSLDPNLIPREQALEARFAAGADPKLVVINQYGQLLDAATRRLIVEAVPTEIFLPSE